jgi:hypothetical protein
MLRKDDFKTVILDHLSSCYKIQSTSGLELYRVAINIPFRKNSAEQTRFLLFRRKKCAFCGIPCGMEGNGKNFCKMFFFKSSECFSMS